MAATLNCSFAAVEVIDGMLPPGAGVKLKTLLDVPTGAEHCLPLARLQSTSSGILCKAGPNVPEGVVPSDPLPTWVKNAPNLLTGS